MNWAYFHLVINHFPIIGAIIGTLLLASGIVFKNEGFRNSGLCTIVFAAVMSLLAAVTGDPATEAVKGLQDVAKSLINRHEDIAAVGMSLLIPSGLLAILTLYILWKKGRAIHLLVIITLVLSILSSIAMVYVGYSGGQIRHSEFRSEASKQYIIDHQNNVEEDD